MRLGMGSIAGNGRNNGGRSGDSRLIQINVRQRPVAINRPMTLFLLPAALLTLLAGCAVTDTADPDEVPFPSRWPMGRY
jgi:hypothetical protein